MQCNCKSTNPMLFLIPLLKLSFALLKLILTIIVTTLWFLSPAIHFSLKIPPTTGMFWAAQRKK